MDYYNWKTIGAAPACRAVRAGAETWPLPSGGFYSGGRTYTHGLQTKRGACYVVCREVMKEVEATKNDMLVEQSSSNECSGEMDFNSDSLGLIDHKAGHSQSI